MDNESSRMCFLQEAAEQMESFHLSCLQSLDCSLRARQNSWGSPLQSFLEIADYCFGHLGALLARIMADTTDGGGQHWGPTA